jgi:hypothetical protein
MRFIKDLFGPPNVENLKKNKDVKKLCKALKYKKDSSVRLAAARALGSFECKEVQMALLETWRRDNDKTVQEEALVSLNKIYHKQAMQFILRLKEEISVIENLSSFPSSLIDQMIYVDIFDVNIFELFENFIIERLEKCLELRMMNGFYSFTKRGPDGKAHPIIEMAILSNWKKWEELLLDMGEREFGLKDELMKRYLAMLIKIHLVKKYHHYSQAKELLAKIKKDLQNLTDQKGQ